MSLQLRIHVVLTLCRLHLLVVGGQCRVPSPLMLSYIHMNPVFYEQCYQKLEKVRQKYTGQRLKEKLAYVVLGQDCVLGVDPFSQEFEEIAAVAVYCYEVEV